MSQAICNNILWPDHKRSPSTTMATFWLNSRGSLSFGWEMGITFFQPLIHGTTTLDPKKKWNAQFLIILMPNGEKWGEGKKSFSGITKVDPWSWRWEWGSDEGKVIMRIMKSICLVFSLKLGNLRHPKSGLITNYGTISWMPQILRLPEYEGWGEFSVRAWVFHDIIFWRFLILSKDQGI